MQTSPKYWEIIADRLKKAGWSLGWVSAVDCEGRTIWIADAHRDDGKRFIGRADRKRTAFLELERSVCIHLLTQRTESLDCRHSSRRRKAFRCARRWIFVLADFRLKIIGRHEPLRCRISRTRS